MASLRILPFRASLRDEIEVPVARLYGMINSDTIDTFRTYLDKIIAKEPKRFIFDFGNVSYVSSSGIGEMIRLSDSFEPFSGAFIITNPSAEVNHLIKLLGLEHILPVLPDIQHAVRLFSKGSYKNKTIALINRKLRDKLETGKDSPAFKPMDPLGNYAIIMVPAKDFFTRFLEKRLAGSDGKLKIAKSISQAAKLIKKSIPDMVIIDDAVEGNKDLVADLKSDMNTNRTRVIRMLREGKSEKDDVKEAEVYIREDETIVEPFDYNELLALAKKEYIKFRKFRKILKHSTKFEIVSTQKAVEEVTTLLYSFLELTPLTSEQISEFHFALREGIDNAYRHGNGKNPEKTIRIEFLFKAAEISVTITDEGTGFDFEYFIDAAKRLKPEDHARQRHEDGGTGGMGIAMMRKCSDSLVYTEPGCKLTISKKLDRERN